MKEQFAFDVIADQPMELAPLPEQDPAKWLLREGDLLFARQSLTLAGAGKCTYVAPSLSPRLFESHLIRVRLDSTKADPRFFHYYFKSPHGRAKIETIVEQVAAAGIRASDLANLRVPVPPPGEQSRIANVLGAMDDLIDGNERLSANLEALALAEFRRAAFDAESTDGATTVPLRELIEVNPARSKPAGLAAYVDMAAVPTSSARVGAVARREASGGARFVNGDTVMARITPCLENGKAAFIDVLADGEVGIGSTEFIVLRPKVPLPPAWAYCLARSERFRDYTVRHMSGSSGRQRASASDVAAYPIRVVRADEALNFHAIVTPLFEALRQVEEEAQQLRATRDELLPLLMSGKVVPGEVSV